MLIVIAGAGNVGRAIARDLIKNGHEVTVIDEDPEAIASAKKIGAKTVLADACEPDALDEANLSKAQIVVAATGDDKVNLVVSLLAKTEYGVPRVVGRVNHPKNEWLFGEAWGVDFSVSTPQMMTALVEEAVTVGELVRLFSLRQSGSDLLEVTLPTDSPVVGKRVGDVEWPIDTALVAILRDRKVITPHPDDPLEAGDELLVVATSAQQPILRELLCCK
jgi:trk system potassium uptake protein TrkA